MELVRTMATVGSLLLYFTNVNNSLLRSEFFTHRKEMENKAYSSGLITEIRVKGRTDCLVHCTEDAVSGNCIAASYNSDSNLCRLYDDQLEKNNAENDQGWQTWGVIRRCRSSPAVPNADVIYGGDFVHAIARYTCKPDYKPCGFQTESRCQANGEWTVIIGFCSQFRWHYPVVPFEAALACQDQDMLHIKIKATPTAETRMSFELMSDKDALLVIGCRFRCYKDLRQIVLNDRKNGKYGVEVRPSGFPFTVNEIFVMEIILSNGKYQISVGGQTWTFKQRIVGVTPEKVQCRYDVSIKLLEILI